MYILFHHHYAIWTGHLFQGNSMTPKERVYAALQRQPADRIPVFMWFHPTTAKHFAGLLEIPPAYVGLAMGDDITQAWINNNYAMEGIVHENEGESHTDYWKITWVKEGAFNQITRFPLKDVSQAKYQEYKFPYEYTDQLLQQMQPARDFARKFQLYLGCDVSPCVFEMYCRLCGMENALYDLAAPTGFSDRLFKRCADFSVHLSELACRQFSLDWLWTGDDVASQRSLMMSPASWRHQIKPHLQRIVQVGKNFNLPVAYHCCGSLYPIIPDLIETGIDILNPIQPGCPDMNPLDLKKEFGNKLSFMGGVDTQALLPKADTTTVQRATADLIEGMTSDGGGFILAASHTIPPETPDDNVFAMYAEAGISREEIFDRAADIRKINASAGL
ncbi:hypothetical protein GF407_05060 [candidate division KSB1 bacterium]|nr:hypothetical protein [candidate division KSB1 bacterium]